MSLGFNWFKEYGFHLVNGFYYDEYDLEYIDGDSTSHSYGNVIKVQNLLEKYGGVRIPKVNTYGIYDKPVLIEPKVMSEACNKVLQSTEVDKVDMRDRFEWFKKLSDEGYYLTYDWE